MKIKNILIILDFFSVWVYNGSTKQREVKLMDKIFDMLKEYGICDYCNVSCTPELLYSIEFKYKGYYTTFSFFEYELGSSECYYIEKIISNLSSIVKAF